MHLVTPSDPHVHGRAPLDEGSARSRHRRQYATFTKDWRPRLRRDSKQQSQKASGLRPRRHRDPPKWISGKGNIGSHFTKRHKQHQINWFIIQHWHKQRLRQTTVSCWHCCVAEDSGLLKGEAGVARQVVPAKVKVFLSITWNRVGGVEAYLHSFLTLVLNEGEWLTSRPGRFTPGNNTGTHWTVAIVQI
jgi:hypothetical protein